MDIKKLVSEFNGSGKTFIESGDPEVYKEICLELLRQGKVPEEGITLRCMRKGIKPGEEPFECELKFSDRIPFMNAFRCLVGMWL